MGQFRFARTYYDATVQAAAEAAATLAQTLSVVTYDILLTNPQLVLPERLQTRNVCWMLSPSTLLSTQ